MGSKNIKRRVEERIAEKELITEEFFSAVQAETGASPSYLRQILRDSGKTLDPIVEGVRAADREELVRTLCALSVRYPDASARVRALVIESKRHHQLALRRQPENPWRAEVLLHLFTWLENPLIYPVWAQLQAKNALRMNHGPED